MLEACRYGEAENYEVLLELLEAGLDPNGLSLGTRPDWADAGRTGRKRDKGGRLDLSWM